MENQISEPPVKAKKSPVRFIIIAIIVIAGGIFLYKKIAYALSHETTDNAQVETQISPVLPRVSGYVKTIAVKDYDSVKTGQLLVQLDDDELQAQLLQMEADYQSAIADITNAKAALNNASISLKVNKGNIDLSEVKMKQAEEDYQRSQNLFADQAITKKQFDDSRYALEQATVQFDNSHKDLHSADSRIPILQASIQKAEASMAMKKAI